MWSWVGDAVGCGRRSREDVIRCRNKTGLLVCNLGFSSVNRANDVIFYRLFLWSYENVSFTFTSRTSEQDMIRLV